MKRESLVLALVAVLCAAPSMAGVPFQDDPGCSTCGDNASLLRMDGQKMNDRPKLRNAASRGAPGRQGGEGVRAKVRLVMVRLGIAKAAAEKK